MLRNSSLYIDILNPETLSPRLPRTLATVENRSGKTHNRLGMSCGELLGYKIQRFCTRISETKMGKWRTEPLQRREQITVTSSSGRIVGSH